MISSSFLPPSFSSRIRTGFLVLVFLALVVSLTPATAPSQAAPPPGDGLALDTFLNLPAEGVLGSISMAEAKLPKFYMRPTILLSEGCRSIFHITTILSFCVSKIAYL